MGARAVLRCVRAGDLKDALAETLMTETRKNLNLPSATSSKGRAALV